MSARKRNSLIVGKIHHWFGRTIALLGLAQVPLGLTLYGSPVALFVLYALAVFALLVIYFILSHGHERRGRNDYDSRYSYASESVVKDRRRRGGRRAGESWCSRRRDRSAGQSVP